jgi:hypothetical protein
MKIGIMQPYLFPYIGYFQLINSVDTFVLYDNIQYSKKGWINRNRVLANGREEYFTVPLKKGSDYLHVVNRVLADNHTKQLNKILNKIEASYRKSPYFSEVFPVLKSAFLNHHINLFDYLHFALEKVLKHLQITTQIIVSSDININHELKSQDKVIAICKALNADCYINPIGGLDLYNINHFSENELKLSFLQSNTITYKQFDNDFIPWLSIIDVMMFNSKESIKTYLNSYSLQ